MTAGKGRAQDGLALEQVKAGRLRGLPCRRHRSPASKTPEDIDRVAGMADPVIRNLQITRAYHDLSAAAAARLGPVANWCTYATWASKQAGRTIRKEDIQRALEAAFRTSPPPTGAASQVMTEASRFGADISVTTRSGLFGRSSILRPHWIGRAPRLPVATFACSRRSAASSRASTSSAAAMRPSTRTPSPGSWRVSRRANPRRTALPPPGLLSLPPGALRGRPGDARAQLILLANLEIGFHEQTRLQPEIAAALERRRRGSTRPAGARRRGPVPGCRLVVRYVSGSPGCVGRRTLLDLAIDALVLEKQALIRAS